MIRETTALGAAYLAGLSTGLWGSREEIRACWRLDRRYEPCLPEGRRQQLLAGWQKAVERAKAWSE